MKKLMLGAMLVGSLALLPSSLPAQDHGHDQNGHGQDSQQQQGHDDHQDSHNGGNRTYYDSAHKDRHEWNDNENQSWNQYRDEHHVKQSDFSRAKRRDQQSYWNWRHQHDESH